MGIAGGTSPHELGPEYELSWPAPVFRSEAGAILSRSLAPHIFDAQASLLLEEAFVDDSVCQEFQENSAGSYDWQDPSRLTQMGMLSYLREHAESLPKAADPADYWVHRQESPMATTPVVSFGRSLYMDWRSLAVEFIGRGYLSNAAPEPCIDGDRQAPGVDEQLDWQVERRTRIPRLWTRARTEEVEQDLVYTLVEVFHDLVARPRNRKYHDYADCGWHYQDHFRPTGQAVYRWKVNELLEYHDTGLLLAESGSDRGRLIRVLSDGRGELVEDVIRTKDSTSKDSVDHAIALFRKRGATRDDKRSACSALALVLEDRRTLIKENLLSGDEGLIFQLANKFHIRHRDGKQFADYGEEFMDWIFWVYLSTIELTNKILESDSPGAPSP